MALGYPLERLYTRKLTGVIYVAGIICGSLAITVFDQNEYAVGASAGAFSLFGAHCLNIIVLVSLLRFTLFVNHK